MKQNLCAYLLKQFHIVRKIAQIIQLAAAQKDHLQKQVVLSVYA